MPENEEKKETQEQSGIDYLNQEWEKARKDRDKKVAGNAAEEGNKKIPNNSEQPKQNIPEANIRKSLSGKDAVWLLPLIAVIGFVWYIFGSLGLVVLAIFIALLPVIIYFMAKEQLWFMSVPQNSAVGIMWGSGENKSLHRLAVVLGSDVFALNAAGERIEAYWFEKKFNIWWMSPIGSVHKYHTVEFLRPKEGMNTQGKEIPIGERRIILTTKDFIEINREIVLPLQIPPIPCADNFDVTIASVAFYVIKTAKDALKALFNVGNLSLALNSKFGIAIKEKSGGMTFDELRAEQESLNSDAWKRMEEAGDFKMIHDDWGTTVRDIGISDVTAEPDAAVALKNVAIESKKADALRKKGEGERDYDKLRGDGEEYRTDKQYAGRASGYAKVAKIAEGAGIRMEQLRTLQIMPSAKIISMPDFTGALSDATGKNPRTLAADLIAAGFTLEQFRDELVRAKQAEEIQKIEEEKTEAEPTGEKKKGKNK